VVARRAQVVLGLAVLVAFGLLASPPGQGAPGAKPPDFDTAVSALEKHADKWLDKPGVVGVGIGVNKAGTSVIHVYRVNDDGGEIPSDVDGVAVAQVRSGRFDPRALPTDRWPRPVPIGVSAGLADFATGTLGARVTDGTNVYVLSNNHVLAGINTATIGDPITQPGPDDGGSDPNDRIATLADYQEIDFNGGDNVMDAAIALTTAGDVGTATPPDGYGVPATTPTVPTIGMGVQKYGRTTGLQQGTVQDVSFSVDVCYLPLSEDFCFPGFEARYVNQIAVSPGTFSAPGDSGSLMVTQGGNQPVALLFAGDGTLTIGNPIIPVLQRFNVTVDGTPAGPGPPGAPTGLNAIAGDGQVALSWAAPSFDGGSSISNYVVYRGTSPNPTSALTTVPPTPTSYVDQSAVNGTTYYYKVSAVNSGSGEGAKSNEASATPIAAVTPTTPLAVVDSFNRADENPLSDAGRWTNAIIGGESGLNVSSNQLACSVTTTCTAWRNATQYGPDTEVYARVPTLPGDSNQIRLYARLQPGASTGYLLRTNQTSGIDEVWLERFSGGATRLLTIPQELTAGDTLLLRVKGSTIEAWRNGGTAWTRLGVVQDSTYSAAGYAGVGLRGTTGRLDDFGARGLGATSQPGAPTALAASAGDGQVALSWTAPSFDGGAAISGYTVYRGTSPNPTSALTTVPSTPTSYVDQSASNGTTYYYKVSASNASGEGAKSNEASATPIAAVAPTTPLAVVDSFNRANENPLSDSGRWTNAIIGGESGLNVSSNQLACSVTTTCTARRNDAQYGPDVEVSARLPTLPGVGNQLRLYARLQGTTGYVLRAAQLSGTDEVWLERFNGGLTRLLTIPQELVAGDTLLLRAKGSTIEAWRLPSGGSWSRLGFVQDSTYAVAGFVGVGLRGTTGRVDDFGARTFGAATPDTTPPTDPASLTASAVGSTQINLSWQGSTDASGINLYRIERCSGPSCGNFSEIATVPGNQTTFQNTGLAPSTSYTYRVRAEDAAPAHNLSGFSNLSSATTLSPPDTTPPTDPSNLQASAVSSSQINLSWSASTDASGIGLYRIERCSGQGCGDFVEITTVPGNQTTFQNTSLTASTSYTYRVRAEDNATPTPNSSGFSNLSSATTLNPPDTTPPTDPASLTASAVGSTQINLSWQGSTDASGINLYRIERCSGPSCGNFSEVATVPGNQTTFQNTGLAPSTSYTYRVRAEDAAPTHNLSGYSNLSSATTLGSPKPLYFSLLNDGTVGGVSVANEDVVSYDGVTYSVAFDGSDVGLASRRLDAFGWLDADSLVFSLDSDGVTLPGVAGTIDDSDVIRFDATSLGTTTSGTFSMYFDGSDVGLTTSGEDVDAFELLANGTIVLSTDGSASVAGVSAAAEDLLVFTPSSLGATTSGTYAMYFDGSDVGISTSNENVDAAAVDAAGRVYLSTTGNFNATGVSGADEDVFVFTPTTLGATTSGAFSSMLYFDGSAFGLGGNDIAAIDLPLGA
jgi:fibronectin type 3 domain-containing protein